MQETTNGDKWPVATNAQSEDVNVNYTVVGLLLILHEGLLDFYWSSEALTVLSDNHTAVSLRSSWQRDVN